MLNLFSTNVSLLYPLKTSENQRYFDVFRGIEVEHWSKKVKLRMQIFKSIMPSAHNTVKPSAHKMVKHT